MNTLEGRSRPTRLGTAVRLGLITTALAGGIAASSRGPGEKYSSLQQRISQDGNDQGPLSVQQNNEVCGPGQYIKLDSGHTLVYTSDMNDADGETVAELTKKLKDNLSLSDNSIDLKYSVTIMTHDGREPVALEEALHDNRVLINSADDPVQDGVLMQSFSCGNLADLPDNHPYRIQKATQDAGNH